MKITECLEKAGFNANAKTILYDGRTGEPFDNEVTVGNNVYLKASSLS